MHIEKYLRFSSTYNEYILKLVPFKHILKTHLFSKGSIVRCPVFRIQKRLAFKLSSCVGPGSWLVSFFSFWFLKCFHETQGFLGTRFENYWYHQYSQSTKAIILIPKEWSVKNKKEVLQPGSDFKKMFS